MPERVAVMKPRSCLPLVEVSPGRMQRGYAEARPPLGTPTEIIINYHHTVKAGKRQTFTIKGEPMGKPRMTRRDKWKQRPCVLAYRSWADSARAAFGKTEKVVLTQPTTLSIVAYFSIPASWSTYKKERAKNIPHTVKPDFDNCIKAVADALFHNDQMICDGWCRKLYDDGRGPRIEVTCDT